MVRAFSRLTLALGLTLLAVGCQPVREDRAINFHKDGDHAAFQHGNEGVFVADPAGGPAVRIFKPDADVVATSSPLWSPTDKRLLFTTARNVDGKEIPRPGGDEDPAGKILYPAHTIYTCWLCDEPKDNKTPPPVAIFQAACDHPGYVAANLAVRWHPDGKRVLFVNQVGEHVHAVFEFDLTSRKSRQVFDRTAEAVIFDWAPDGEHLVCVLGNMQTRATDGVWIGNSKADDWWQVPESAPLAQGALLALLEQLRALRPIWSRQGDRCVFVSSRATDTAKNGFTHRLYLASPKTREIAKMAEGPQWMRDVHWSLAGDLIGYVAGAGEGPLVIVRTADKSASTLVPSVRAFVGWDERNLAYVSADPVPQAENAAWVFLLTPNPQYRDALWLAPTDASSRGEKVFAGMQMTFPQRSPKGAKMSLWATFQPSYRSWSSLLVDFLAFAARIDEKQGKSTSINLDGLRLRPGDPALLLDPKDRKLDWKTVNAREQIQVGHYYQMKGDFETAWLWYDKANQAGNAKDVRESLFFQFRCLKKLGRDAEALDVFQRFEREFWPKLPQVKKDDKNQGLGAAEFLLRLADPKSPHGMVLQDLFVAEVFLSLDAAADGEAFFRQAVQDAPSDAVKLNKAVLLSQFLLLSKKHVDYLDLAETTLLPLAVSQDAFATAGEKADGVFGQLSFFVGRQMAVLPLCAPEFLSAFDGDRTQGLVVRLEELRKGALNDRQRLWLDVMLQAAFQRLGQEAQAHAAAKRIAGNRERLDTRHGTSAAALIAEIRQGGTRMEELRKMLQLNQ